MLLLQGETTTKEVKAYIKTHRLVILAIHKIQDLSALNIVDV